MNIERAMLVKHRHVPQKLYKYRRFSAEHLGALNRGVLWMSAPNRFNDPYDAAVRFDADRFWVEDYSVAEFLRVIKKRQRSGSPWQPVPLRRPIASGEWRRKVFGDILKDATATHRSELEEFADSFFREHREEGIRRMSEGFRSGFSVLSLSENYSATLMWSHYSDSHRGFCVEYDFSVLNGADIRKRLCFPVLYTKKLRDATRYMAKKDMKDYNNLFGIYMCLIKKDDWSYEREWRIIDSRGAVSANSELEMPLPSAILLGTNASPNDEATMRTFCKDRGIQLRRMVQDRVKFDLNVVDVPM